jgi:hypothetical protein
MCRLADHRVLNVSAISTLAPSHHSHYATGCEPLDGLSMNAVWVGAAHPMVYRGHCL